MSTKMRINEQKMLDYYEKLMDQVYLLYHSHPTNLTHVPLSDAELAEMSYYAAMAKELGGEYSASIPKRKLKKVYSMTDSNHSNGLLRKKFR
jgi:hypothetical protein